MSKYTKQEQEDAIKQLRQWLKPGDTVSTTIGHVSNSGMYRTINCFICVDNEIVNINWYVLRALNGYADDKKDGIGVSGCGMDMGFSIVYNLGRVLFPKGFKLAKGQYGRNGDKSGYDKDGGYALKQRWI